VTELARRLGVAGLAGPVQERTQGHTLFAVESLRAAAEGGGDEAAVPATLRDAVLGRVRRAGPEVETLLRAAVVTGNVVDLEVVAALLGRPVEATAAVAERALAARLLVEDEGGSGYRFANDLVREVLYQTAPGRPGSPATAAWPACWLTGPRRPPAMPPPATGRPRPGPGWRPPPGPPGRTPTATPSACSTRPWPRPNGPATRS